MAPCAIGQWRIRHSGPAAPRTAVSLHKHSMGPGCPSTPGSGLPAHAPQRHRGQRRAGAVTATPLSARRGCLPLAGRLRRVAAARASRSIFLWTALPLSAIHGPTAWPCGAYPAVTRIRHCMCCLFLYRVSRSKNNQQIINRFQRGAEGALWYAAWRWHGPAACVRHAQAGHVPACPGLGAHPRGGPRLCAWA